MALDAILWVGDILAVTTGATARASDFAAVAENRDRDDVIVSLTAVQSSRFNVQGLIGKEPVQIVQNVRWVVFVLRVRARGDFTVTYHKRPF